MKALPNLLYKGMSQKNIFSKSLSWFANHTYRKIPIIIEHLQSRPIQTHYLTYQNLNNFPKNAKNIGFDVIRRAHKKKYHANLPSLQQSKKYRIVQRFMIQKSQDYQKPIQLVCPICMDFFCGPVSTTCGHTFCLQCLDEAILFNPNCPVCRNQIRGEELIICKSIQTLILSFLSKFEDQVYQGAFQQRKEEYQFWIKNRTIDPMIISQGDQIDVRDTQFVWCKATVLKIYKKQNKNNSLMVHYEGWSQTYNQIIYLNSQRLATLGFYTKRKQIPHYNLNNGNHSHMYSYVVIQRNHEQNENNFNALNGLNGQNGLNGLNGLNRLNGLDDLNGLSLQQEQDAELRLRNLGFNIQRDVGLRLFRLNQRDYINQQQNSWEDYDDTFVMSGQQRNTNRAQISIDLSQRGIVRDLSNWNQSQNELELYQNSHIRRRPTRILIDSNGTENSNSILIDSNGIENSNINSANSLDMNSSNYLEINYNNSLVNISVQMSQQQDLITFHQNRFVQQSSWDIDQNASTQGLEKLIQLINQEDQKAIQQTERQNQQEQQNQKIELNEQKQQSYELFMSNIWKDWKNYKIINGLQEKQQCNQNTAFTLNKNNQEKSFYKDQELNLKSDYVYRKGDRQLYSQRVQQNTINYSFQQNLSGQFNYQNGVSQKSQYSLQLQQEKQYQTTTFKQLCRQFDSELAKELQRQRQLFSFQSDQEKCSHKHYNKKRFEKTHGVKFFQYQYNPQSEEKEQIQLIQTYQSQKHSTCELNEQISKFLNQLVQNAEESYMRQTQNKKHKQKAQIRKQARFK